MNPSGKNTLIVITGPTASGKTDMALRLARAIGCDIISADSRQIYRGIPICTAAPSAAQLAEVTHHFVGTLPLDAPYSAARFEEDVLALLPSLWARNPVQIMCGGSMMYIDAVCDGIDELPTISGTTRQHVKEIYERQGLEEIRRRLLEADPAGYERVDALNPRRNIHALEICLEADAPWSSLLTGKKKQRDFDIRKFYIDIPRQEMFDRINRRVDAMVEAGLEREARQVYPLRYLNSLNTVGFKEMFAYFDGLMDFHTAVERLKKNTRVYAKKQLTWLKRAADAVPVPYDADISACGISDLL